MRLSYRSAWLSIIALSAGLWMLILAMILILVVSHAKAQDNPFVYLVGSDIMGQSASYSSPVIYRRHDFGPGPMPVSGDAVVPRGYAASDNANLWGGAAVNTWSYGDNPLAFNRTNGDGGQIISVAGWISRFWATQDGSYPGLQYFVGATCGGDGWVLFDTSRLMPTWVSQVAELAISRASPTDCSGGLGGAFTRYQQGPVAYLTQQAGSPGNVLYFDSVVSEHYDNISPDQSSNMERNWFARGVGLVRWESWSKTAPIGADLAARCPVITVNGYYYPETSGWRLTNCRYWMNFVLAPPGFTLGVYNWPYVQ